MSNKTIYYKQCHLVKPTGWEQTTYLPEKFAVVGKILKLKNTEDKWDNGWIVERVSRNRVAEDMLPDYHDNIKRHRRATGDSLPK